MDRRSLTSIALALLLAPTTQAQSSLDDRLEELLEVLEQQRADLNIPGLAIAVVHGDEVVLAEGLGWADVERKVPVTAETIFAIGSTTKAFTSTLIGMSEAIEWDDEVTEHLPWFELDLDAGPKAQATVRDLLSHRTGFTRMGVLWAGGTSSERILRTAVKAEPWDGFREGFHYNNVMYLAAGEALAAATGVSWQDYLETHLLEPLGMASTTHSFAAVQKDERLAKGYLVREATGTFEPEGMRNLDNIAPAGSINSNVLDMARWVRLLLARGELDGQRIVPEKAITDTWEAQVDIGPGVSYGMGWMLREWEGRRVIEHGGNIDGFAAQVSLLPTENLGYVLLTNVSATPLQSGSIQLVFDTLLGEETAGESIEASSEKNDLTAFEGDYVGNFAHFQDAIFTVAEKNGRLTVDIPGQQVFEMKPPDEEGLWEFALPVGVQISWVRGEDGEVKEMILHQSGLAFGLPRKGVEIEPEVPLDLLAEYLGTYRDEDMGDMQVLVQNNRLAIDVPGQMVYELLPPNEEDEWVFRATDKIRIVFRDEAGEIRSLSMFQDGLSERVMARVAGAQQARSLEEVLDRRDDDQRDAWLEDLGAVRVAGTIRLAQSGVEGTFVSSLRGSKIYRLDIDFGDFGSSHVAVNGEEGWATSSFDEYKELLGAELDAAVLQNLALPIYSWRSAFDSLTVLRSEELDGRPTNVLVLRQGDLPPVHLYVDQETGDLVRADAYLLVEGAGHLPIETRLEDHSLAGELRFPRRMVQTNDAVGRSILEVESLTPIEALPADWFTPPAEAPAKER